MKPTDYFKETGTDKNLLYPDFYDMVISALLHLEGAPLRVLEVGCIQFLNKWGSGSSNAFSKMPFIEKYVGIDKVAPEHAFGQKATFIQGDAYTAEMINQIQALSEKFHLVIDDGSHACEDQIFFLQNYERFCTPISAFICEDIRMSHVQPIDEALNDEKLLFISGADWKTRQILSAYKKNLYVKFNFNTCPV